MQEIKSHTRVNDILLGPLERPALQWLSAHMPAWVNPDILTLIGVLGSIIVFAGYCLTNIDQKFLLLASLGFVINWFGDSLDGTLARYRNIQRPRYGYFVDHTVDAFSEVLVFIGLGLSPYVKIEIAFLALTGYFLISIYTFLRTSVDGVFQISYGKIGPTELRLIVIIANTAVLILGNPIIIPLGTISVFDLVSIAIAVGLGTVFVVSTIKYAISLAELDKLS